MAAWTSPAKRLLVALDDMSVTFACQTLRHCGGRVQVLRHQQAVSVATLACKVEAWGLRR